jgi:riboflavin synthase
MYTGIIRGKFPIVSVDHKPGLSTFCLELPDEMLTGISIGASVALSGVCLTVTSIDKHRLTFDAMQETLDKTTLGSIAQGDLVNVERSARIGDENGGHDMYGHVTGMATIVSIETPENNTVMTFQVPQAWMKFILPKGFVGLDGASLTVTDPDADAETFKVWFIPETLEKTTFGNKRVGDKVNLELEKQTQVIVETVERVMRERLG